MAPTLACACVLFSFFFIPFSPDACTRRYNYCNAEADHASEDVLWFGVVIIYGAFRSPATFCYLKGLVFFFFPWS